jgi:hypothetical protein
MEAPYELGRADRLWKAISLLKQDLRLKQTKSEAGIERAHWLLDRYEGELFGILAKHNLDPRNYGYENNRLTSTQG